MTAREPLEDIAVGMPVKIIFIEVTDGVTLPYAVPRREGGTR